MELLHSKILGEGKPFIILHGFLGMSDNWKTLGSQYAENGFQVHLVDQRNHGKSFHSPDFDYELLSQDAINYMDHHGIDSAYVLGHSMGGKTAMQLATSHPERVEKLIVADIAPKFYPPHHDFIFNGLSKLNFDEISNRREADEELAKHIQDMGIRMFLLKNLYWVEQGKLGFRFNFDVLKDKMSEIGENIAPTAIYEGPTLFLRGDRSEYIMPNDYPELKRHFPNSEIETIDKASHWLHAENPKQFFEKSLRFLNS
ncbi:alpha/beta fold hydrolase [Flagellimonas zhangzhouensis]|uniref:Pimeloyl-ACP methyl ester carboxylesterase n=1 Tax=Flagellimonas zhangzhouensis TaxID=1073328 RepID=A0A1H2X4L4_9FLAO|nr:alpha/beta fold hydrolase [Allomuricauda zhangzhouensis]SDQ27933.1 Pimeloyl-ACP methyl ester carboxylesterase [Allomuricauda zhangzhouensis]SDW87731.1 Pimeloyl-ACP methyl ester carboxylesterase [Allomuricauda zhangzhouensis]